MSIINQMPNAPILVGSIQVGYTTVKFKHAESLDADVQTISVWYYKSGDTPVRQEFPYAPNELHEITGLDANTEYFFEFAFIDSFLQDA